MGGFLALLLAIQMGVVEAAVIQRQTVAQEGDPAPGGTPGETFGSLAHVRPLVNAGGDVAFVAPIRGIRPDGSEVDGVFVHTARGLVRLAQEGALVPGLAPLRFGRLSRLAVNDAGNVLALSQDTDGEVYLSNASGAWRVVARSNDPDPAPVRFHPFTNLTEEHQWQPLLRSAAEPDVLFAALPVPQAGSVGAPGTWMAGADGWNPEELFVNGFQAPGVPSRSLLSELTYRSWGPSPARRSVFAGRLFLSEPTVSPTNAQVLWTQSGRGEVQVLARAGSLARVGVLDVFYGEFHGVTVNGAGTIAFVADLATHRSGFPRALFHGTPQSHSPVVRDGDPVTRTDGTPLGPIQMEGTPILNQAGQVLLFAIVGDRRVLARWSPDLRLEAVLVEGESSPGIFPDWRLGRVGAAHFNASGRVAALAGLDAPEAITQAWGLWVTDATSAPVLVAMTALEPDLIKPPAGVPLLTEGLEINPAEGFAGGSDGLPRFFGDGQQVVYSGRPKDGPSGVFLVSVDAGVPSPPDETFRWAPRDLGVWSGLAASDPSAWELNEPARLFPNAGIFARPDKDWTGARLRLEVIENGDPAHDLMGLDGLGLARQQLALVAATGELSYANRPLGRLSRPQPGVLEITLAQGATTDGLRALTRVLGFGSTRALREALRNDARHVEERRRLQLRLTDAAGRTADLFQMIDTPKAVGLVFEGLATNQDTWASADTESTTITLQPQLHLSDGSRVRLGCSPAGEALQWFPNAAAYNVVRESADNRLCAGITMTFGGAAGYPSMVRLHSWETLHTLWRRSGLQDVFDRGFGVCVWTFFSLWVDSQRSGAPSGRATAAAVPASPTPAPGTTLATDLLAGPYALREWMRQSDAGRRWIGLYEQHSGEVVRLMLTDVALMNEVLSVLREFSTGIREFLSGRGEQWILRPDLLAQVNRVWDRLEDQGSSELRGVLQRERARYHGLQDFAGRTIAEWGELLEIQAPETPFVTASSPRLDAGGFHVEANRVDGLTYSLWRRSSNPGSLWERVAQAGLRLLEATVQLSDPETDADARLYQVRAESP